LGGSGRIVASAPAPGGGFVVAGEYYGNDGEVRFDVAKFGADDSLFNFFKPQRPDAPNNVKTEAVGVQADGLVVLAGTFTVPNNNGGYSTYSGITRWLLNGETDSTFAQGGQFNGRVRSLAIDSSGMIVVGGAFNTYKGTACDRLVRLKKDGTVDTTFKPAYGVKAVSISKILIQPNGSILIAGSMEKPAGSTARDRVIRLNTNGTLDTTFDQNFYLDGTIETIALQADGRTLVGGSFGAKLLRLNANGTRDTTLNTGSGFTANAASSVKAIGVQSDGSFVVAGTFSNYNGKSCNGAVRLNVSGLLDAAFVADPIFKDGVSSIIVRSAGNVVFGGNYNGPKGAVSSGLTRVKANGTVDLSLATRHLGVVEGAYDVIESQGKLVLAGGFDRVNGNACNGIARFNANGTLDSTFKLAAKYTGSIGKLAAQSDGKLIVARMNPIASDPNNATKIERLNADGTEDKTYAGIRLTGFDNFVLLPDGRLIVTGYISTNPNSPSVPCAIRLLANGTKDTAFTPDSRYGLSDSFTALSMQSDGRMIISGSSKLKLERTTVNLTRDTAFDSSEFDDQIRTAVVQADGRVMVGGAFSSFAGVSRNKIARLKADGKLDTTFNPGTGFEYPVELMAVQANGQIVVYGGLGSYNGVYCDQYVRLNTDGKMDTSFKVNDVKYYPTGMTFLRDGRLLLLDTEASRNGVVQRGFALLKAD